MSRELISKLPEDLIIQIAAYSSIADVFALKQTCRSLNRMTDSDYLWHQILPRAELPLDLSPFNDFRKFTATELRDSALRALKLRKNWANKYPQVRNWSIAKPPSYEGTFDDLKLLNNASILLGVRRDRHSQRPSMIVSAFTLLDVRNPRLVVQICIPVIMKDFDACVEDEGTTLILAASVTKMGSECLEVYAIQIPVSASTICTGSYGTTYSFRLNEGDFFHKVSLHGDFLASSIPTHIDSEGRHVPQVLIANWKTRQQITVVPQFDKPIETVNIKVLQPDVAIIVASESSVRVILAPLSVITHGSVNEQPYTSRSKQQSLPQFPYAEAPIMDFYDISISSNTGFGPYVPPTSLSLIVFPTLSRLDVRQSKKALYIRFEIHSTMSTPPNSVPATPSPVSPSSSCSSSSSKLSDYDFDALLAKDRSHSPSSILMSSIHPDLSTPFDLPVGSYPEHTEIGTTGRRAVWVEQSLKSDYVQILRFDYDHVNDRQRPPSVSVLLPPEPQLPFKPSSVRSLAFDEATGRLCAGLYNGSVYILDYV